MFYVYIFTHVYSLVNTAAFKDIKKKFFEMENMDFYTSSNSHSGGDANSNQNKD